jgi:hypothetical protein
LLELILTPFAGRLKCSTTEHPFVDKEFLFRAFSNVKDGRLILLAEIDSAAAEFGELAFFQSVARTGFA